MDMTSTIVLFAISIAAGVAATIHSGLAVGMVVAVACILLATIAFLLMIIIHELRIAQKKL